MQKNNLYFLGLLLATHITYQICSRGLEGKIYQNPFPTQVPDKTFVATSFDTTENLANFSIWSAVFEGYIAVPVSGIYQFYAEVYDNLELFIEDRLIVNYTYNYYFGDGSATNFGSVELNNTALHPIKISYNSVTYPHLFIFWKHNCSLPLGILNSQYLFYGNCTEYSYSIPEPQYIIPPSVNFNESNGIFASYFSGINFNVLLYECIEDNIAIEIYDENQSFIPCLSSRWFYSVIWKGYLTLPSDGLHNLTIYSDDGFQFIGNGTEIYSDWTIRPGSSNDIVFELPKNVKYPFELRYFQYAGSTVIKLYLNGSIVPKSWLTPIVPSDNYNFPSGNPTTQNLHPVYTVENLFPVREDSTIDGDVLFSINSSLVINSNSVLNITGCATLGGNLVLNISENIKYQKDIQILPIYATCFGNDKLFDRVEIIANNKKCGWVDNIRQMIKERQFIVLFDFLNCESGLSVGEIVAIVVSLGFFLLILVFGSLFIMYSKNRKRSKIAKKGMANFSL